MQIIVVYCTQLKGRNVFELYQKCESQVGNPWSEVTSESSTDYIDRCCLQRHIHAVAVFRTPAIRGESRAINKTCLQIIKRNTYFISRTSSKCFLLSARRLVKWVSFSAKDCCVEDNFAFIDSSSCFTFSMAIISSST